MASTVPNKTAFDAASRLIAGKTWEVMLLTGVTTGWPTAATARDLDFAADLAADEIADASYSRQTLSLTVQEDDANDRGEIHAGDVTFPALSGAEVLGVAVIEVVTTDADSPIRSIHDLQPSSTITPNGEDLILRIGTEGLIHVVTTA